MTARAASPQPGLRAVGEWLTLSWRRFRIRALYLARHRRLPDIDHPRRFTEWVQWRKLYGREPLLDRLTDKLHSKAVVERSGTSAAVIPTLWSGVDLPVVPPAPLPLMVKANHGCRQFMAVRTMADWERARRTAPRWLERSYGGLLDEHAYQTAERSILVEPFLGGANAGLPEDYKLYVFRGRAMIIQHHVGRGHAHEWTQYDRAWQRVGGSEQNEPPPMTLPIMIEAAEKLGQGHDFVRVDFYEVGGKLWFGEFCLFPGSGLDPFTPASLDLELGKHWSDARGEAFIPLK